MADFAPPHVISQVMPLIC